MRHIIRLTGLVVGTCAALLCSAGAAFASGGPPDHMDPMPVGVPHAAASAGTSVWTYVLVAVLALLAGAVLTYLAGRIRVRVGAVANA